MKYEEIRFAWNAQADEFNQWVELGLIEKVEWAARFGAAKERAARQAYTSDGWFNATEAAAKFGKAPYEWQRLPETVAYISRLERKYGKIPYLKTKRGNTWLHPELAIMFSRWLYIDE